MKDIKNLAWHTVLHKFHLLLSNLTKSMASKCPIPVSMSTAYNAFLRNAPKTRWCSSRVLKGKWRDEWWRVWSQMEQPTFHTALLLLYCSFFSVPDIPSPAILIPWKPIHQLTKPSYQTSSMNVALTLPPMHLVDTSLVRVSLVYIQWYFYTSIHTSMPTHACRWTETHRASRMPHTHGAGTL